jgi:hypothetical protein
LYFYDSLGLTVVHYYSDTWFCMLLYILTSNLFNIEFLYSVQGTSNLEPA